MSKVYKLPEIAYSEMDYEGKGCIREEDFYKALLCYRLPFTREELHEFFNKEQLFSQGKQGQMNFEVFKKSFFPHRFSGNDESREEPDTLVEELGLGTENKDKVVLARLSKLEDQIKTKFANLWVSMRKAFLDLDRDYDGYVTAEDIAKSLGRECNIQYKDLLTLVKNRDSKRRGKIDF